MLKSKKFIAILIIAISLMFEIALSMIFYRLDKATDSYIEYLYFSTQIISGIFVISGVVIAVWQYYLSCKDAKINLEIIQVQRAIDLSEYYKDNILKYVPAIMYVFDNVGVSSIFEKIPLDRFHDFDSYELNELLSATEIAKLKQIQSSSEFSTAILEANDIYGLNLQFLSYETKINENGQEKIIKRFEKNSLEVAFMANLLNATINNMEFFALHFKHNVADESVVYQSLHQSYFDFIPYIYYYIANGNTYPSNKLFTNVIWLFLKWRETKLQQNAERSLKACSVPSHGTIVGK